MRLSPFTPDSAGVATMFADCPAMVVPFDMNGTVSAFRNRVGVSEESLFRMASALGARESDYVMGSVQGYADEALALQERYGGDTDTVVFLHGPVSAMVGADLSSLAARAERESGRRMLAVECTTSAFHDEGLARAMMVVYERVRNTSQTRGQATCGPYLEESGRSGVNVLGLNAVDCHDLSCRERILDAIERTLGAPIISVWGCRDYWQQWEQACHARENIVASASALKLAKAMKRDWGIPYRRIDEVDLDLSGASRVYAQSCNANIIIVHEQFMANLARCFFEKCGCNVTVASFHKMDRSAKREGDIHLKSEGDLVSLLNAGVYDVLVGDPALLSCVDEIEELSFVAFEHSAVAPVLSDKGEMPSPFSAEWVEMVQGVLERYTRAR